VERIAERLRSEGLNPWLDRWRLAPGGSWQREIAQGLRSSRTCAVLVGAEGLGDWAREELQVAQDRAAKEHAFRLFMVLLPGAPKPDDPSLDFLANRTWVDLRSGVTDRHGFRDLVSAVTGVPWGDVNGEVKPGRCPYRGLQVFEEDHADLFFGRAADIAWMVQRLTDSRFLAVLGPSGCGKSSLVRAGLVPALKQGALPASHRWAFRLMTPGARPLSTLAAQLVSLAPDKPMQATVDGLRSDERTLDLAIPLALASRPADERVMLVVDQLEEVFTLCGDEAERAAFLANLRYAGSIPGGRLVVLVAMRADFYHRCAEYPALWRLMGARQFLVSPLGSDALREVIEQPAWHVGLQLEDGLVETILDDVGDQPGTLPLLEYALLEVWGRRRGRMLTLQAYVDSGGVEGGLAQRADTIYEGLTLAQQQLTRRVLLRLVQPGQGTEDTRRRAEFGELRTRPEDEADLQAVVKELTDARLLVVSSPGGTQVVDVAHEALIRGWPQLRGWIEEDRELLLAQRRLTDAATDWDHHGREDGLLYRGARLAAWQDRPLDDLNDLERAFLATSRKREARERTAKRRRTRLALAGLSGGLVIISALAVVALGQRDLAFSRELTARAETQLESDPELSLLLTQQAFDVRPTAEAEAALRQATLESRVRATLRGHDRPVYGVAFSPDGRRVASASVDGSVRVWDSGGGAAVVVLRHDGPVGSVAFSPDGQRIASSGADGVRVWDSGGGASPVVLEGHDGPVGSVAFSPDGRRVASASVDGSVRVWDSGGGAALVVLRHDGPVRSVAFSPDGQRIASASDDATVRVWDLVTGADSVVLRHDGPVFGVAFSPDGRRVASVSDDGSVEIWDSVGGAGSVVLGEHDGPVAGVAFSPDGRRVASASDDGSVRIWDSEGGTDPVVLRGHDGPVFGVVFSPDGRRVASASIDGTVRVWDSGGIADSVVLRHDSAMRGVAFSPDGQRVASAGADGTVRVWDSAGGAGSVVLGEHGGPVFGVAFSPDGRRVASAGADSAVRVWDVAGGADPVVLRHDNQVTGVAFSPDGQQLASSSIDSTVRVWDVAGGSDPVVLRHSGPVIGVALSPDGRRVAGAGADGVVRVWDFTGAADPVVLPGHDGLVHGVAFSPDGRRLASAGADGTVRVWDVASGAGLVVLRGHDGQVTGVAFGPNGQQLVSGSTDGTVRLWNSRGGPNLVMLRDHNGPVGGVAFSPDGQRVVSASDDGTVRVWTCEVCGSIGEVLALADERVTRELTCEERRTFLNERRQCP